MLKIFAQYVDSILSQTFTELVLVHDESLDKCSQAWMSGMAILEGELHTKCCFITNLQEVIEMNPTRVLCVFSLLNRGGAETMCMNLYKNIDRSKVQFDFVKHGDRIGDFEQEIQELGGIVYTAPIYRVYNHVQYEKWWRNFFKEHEEYRIVHAHYFTVASIYLKIAQDFHRTAIAHSHNTQIDGIVRKILVKRIETHADYCFACTEDAGKWMFPNKPYVVLNNAIDSEKFQYNREKREEIRASFGIKNELVIGIVGRFNAEKNPFYSLRIIDEAAKSIPKFRVLWIGVGDKLKKEVENKIIEAKLQDIVYMLGGRSDVPQLLQAMDVFLMPSLFEGLPVSLIEAQAAGLPCLCSERISRKVDITGLCSFFPLDDDLHCWIDALLNIDVHERKNQKQAIIDAGYDVKETSKEMERFYLDLANKNES